MHPLDDEGDPDQSILRLTTGARAGEGRESFGWRWFDWQLLSQGSTTLSVQHFNVSVVTESNTTKTLLGVLQSI